MRACCSISRRRPPVDARRFPLRANRSRTPSIALADELGFAFRRPELVRQALTHRSFGTPHNERLEFIGDAVLNCVIAEALFERFPAIPEGELSRRAREPRQSRHAGAARARRVAVGRDPPGRRRGRRAAGPSGRRSSRTRSRRSSVRSSSTAATTPLARRSCASMPPSGTVSIRRRSRRTRRRGCRSGCRRAGSPVPEYAVTALAGEAHAQTFTIECRIPALGIVATGSGPSRRAAEQAAAERAYAAAIAAIRRRTPWLIAGRATFGAASSRSSVGRMSANRRS